MHRNRRPKSKNQNIKRDKRERHIPYFEMMGKFAFAKDSPFSPGKEGLLVLLKMLCGTFVPREPDPIDSDKFLWLGSDPEISERILKNLQSPIA